MAMTRSDDDTVITIGAVGFKRGDWIEVGTDNEDGLLAGAVWRVIDVNGTQVTLAPVPWWQRNVRMIAIIILALAFVCFAVDLAQAEHNKAEVLLEPAMAPLYSLEVCDAEWKLRGHKRPRYAIVVNQTLCEPKRPCKYRVQAYSRICSMGEKA